MRVFGQRPVPPVKTSVRTVSNDNQKRKTVDELLALAKDRRKYRRVQVRLSGRFMRENKNEYPCYTNDISAGGISLSASVKCEPGEYVVLYIEEIGRLKGIVTRNHDGGFAVAIEASTHKREKLVAALTWLLNRHELRGMEARRHERLSPTAPHSTLIRNDGTQIDATVLDLSLGGARIVVNAALKMGEKVILGKTAGRVIRVDADGIGIQFDTEQNTATLRPYFSSPLA